MTRATKLRKAPVWPETVYMDGKKEVTFPRDTQSDLIGCPTSWAELFKKMMRQGKHPYMMWKLDSKLDQTAVGMAFRNYMQYIYDDVRFDSFRTAEDK